MATTVLHTQELVVVECTCGIAYAIPETLHAQLLSHRGSDPGETRSVYCPLGHNWHYTGISDETRAKRRADAAEAQAVALRDQLDAEQKAHARTRKRISNGVCPCCKRSFVKLAAHMKTKHPDYSAP
jgi:hypothetical protein